jgi:hypothetical protein
VPADPSQDWQPLLDAALERLPDKYRVPIIMCDLEGKSRRDAALQLQVSEGTLSSRLARGRRLLAQRLTRHGLTLSGGALAAILAQNVASAQVPLPLVQAVSQAGAKVIVGQAPTCLAFSAPVVALTEGVMKAMLIGKLKTLALALVVCAAVALCGVWMTGNAADPRDFANDAQQQLANAQQPGQPPQADPPPQNAPAPQIGQRQIATAAQPAGSPMPQPNPTPASPLQKPPHFRIEAVVTIPNAKDKTFSSAPVLVSLGQRTPYEFRTTVPAAGGQAQPTQVMWNIEIVRQRGMDVLVNITFDKRDRQSSAVVRGQSMEFEDFVALDAWKTLTDATWPGVEFKIKVSTNLGPGATVSSGKSADTADPLRVPGELPPHPKAQPKAPSATPPDPEATANMVFRIQHVPADMIRTQVMQKLGGKEVSVAVIERANSIVISGPAALLNEARALIMRLDVPNPQPMPGADKPLADNGPVALAISPDRRVIAFSGEGQVMLMDARTGKLLSKSAGDGTPKALAFSPDGKLLVSGTQQGAVNIYDAATGKMIRKFHSSRPILRIEVSPDGPTVIFFRTDQTRMHWNVTTGEGKEDDSPAQK